MKNRPLTHKPELEEIIKRCEVCHIAMVDQNNMPYILPFNFGYKDDTIYLHSAPVGKKIDILKNNPNVCVAFNTDHQLRWQSEKVACSWSMKYRSILAYGKVEFITDYDKKLTLSTDALKRFRKFGRKYWFIWIIFDIAKWIIIIIMGYFLIRGGVGISQSVIG